MWLREQLAQILERIENVKDAIDEHRKSQKENSQIQPRITVETKSKKNKKEWVWACIKGTLEILVAVAVIAYSVFAYHNWQEQIDATNFSARQAKSARQSLNETVKNFKADQRAWVGIVQVKPDIANVFPISPTFKYLFKNFGRTPAIDVITTDNAYVYGAKFPKSPSYKHKMPIPELNSKSTLFPDSTDVLDGSAYICQYYAADIANGTKWCYTYGYITYRDEFGQRHITHFCYRHGRNPLGHQSVLCDTYNDAN